MSSCNGETMSQMRRAFVAASQQHRDSFRSMLFTIAGYPVEIRVVGKDLAREIEDALAHLRSTEVKFEPDLVFELWDQDETGVDCGILSTSAAQNEFCVVKTSSNGRFVIEERSHSCTWLDRESNHAVGVTKSSRLRHVDERARPFQRPLSVWLNDKGIQFIHAGLVATDDTGVLFIGAGGAGKSSSSIASMLHGFRFLGDDFVGIEKMPDGTFRGHSLFASCLVDSGHLKRFPQLEADALRPNYGFETKSVVYLARSHSDQLISEVSIGLLLLPKVVDSPTSSWRRASKAETMLALAPTSVLFTPTPGARALDQLADLITTVPAYWLELGTEIEDIPRVIEQIISSVHIRNPGQVSL